MAKNHAFECEQCKSQVMIDAGDSVPECCGRKMRSIPLDQCTLTLTAEHSRFDQDDDPCDDGRAG